MVTYIIFFFLHYALYKLVYNPNDDDVMHIQHLISLLYLYSNYKHFSIYKKKIFSTIKKIRLMQRIKKKSLDGK